MEVTEVCPDIMHHTECPNGYLQWHEWARRMSKAHKQIKCSGCGLFAIWVPKPEVGGLTIRIGTRIMRIEG